MQAVILAGGLGTRFRPLTLNTPKAMIPIMGKPYLEYQLQFIKNYDITNVLLCVGYLGGKITGAGGGGYFMFYCKEDRQNDLRRALENEKLRFLDFKFSDKGATILNNGNSL